MRALSELVLRIAELGGSLILDGNESISFRLPKGNSESLALLEVIKAEKHNLLNYLRSLAPCGSPHCAGCYDVGDGRKIHPPKCGEDFRDWQKRWERRN